MVHSNNLFGLIGHPLSHSFSKSYFTNKFHEEGIHASYDNFDLADIAEFPSLLTEHRGLIGLNVTIPYKEAIIPYLDGLSTAAQEIGAVNTIQFIDGQLFGHNTDYFGFAHSFAPLLLPGDSNALVLGTGGSSKAVTYVLGKLGLHYSLVSRSPGSGDLTYAEINEQVLSEYSVIINTTPVGMFPNINQAPPLPYQFITLQHLLFDLIYNPSETLFLQKGREAGARTKNGLEMLEIQAEEAWAIWNG